MKILLVEDNENTATLTKMYLEKMGVASHIDHTYRIKPFESLINLHKYDLVLVDYHLQFFDAPEFIKLTRESKKNSMSPIIVTSHELSSYEQKEVESLGVHYIRRPDDYMLFIELIKNTLQKMH